MFTRPESPFFSTQRVEKPWGHEILWAWSESYAAKILHVRRGESLSLQFHRSKDETMSLLHGSVRIETGASAGSLSSRVLGPGDCVRLRAGTVHRVEALLDSDILEVSTTELDDVVRLSDRYGR